MSNWHEKIPPQGVLVKDYKNRKPQKMPFELIVLAAVAVGLVILEVIL